MDIDPRAVFIEQRKVISRKTMANTQVERMQLGIQVQERDYNVEINEFLVLRIVIAMMTNVERQGVNIRQK